VAEKFRTYQDRQQEPLRQIEAEKARLGQEINGLESNLETLQANERLLPELESQLKEVEEKVSGCHKQLAQKSALEDEIAKLNQERADARAENPRLKAEMDDLRSRLDQLEKTTEPACPVCKKPLSEKDRQVMIDQYYSEGNNRKAKFRANESLLKDFDNRMAQKEAALTGLRQVDDSLRNATRQADQLRDRIGQVHTQRAQWDATSAPHLAELQRLLAGEHFIPEARKVLAAIEGEMRSLGYDAAAHTTLKQKELTARQVEGEFASLGKAKAAMAPLGRQISDLEGQLARQEKEIQQLQEAHDSAAAQLAAEQAGLPDLREVEDALYAAQEALNEHNRLLGSARQSVAVLATLKERKKAFGEEREEVSRLIEQYKMLERAFGKDGVPALLIEQALPEIEENANLTLGRLSDNSMSVRFDTQRAYKDEKREDRKETLDIRISDGSGTRDYEMFSGGEAFRVNFAIRLALSRILAQRAGARLRTLVIDEGFGNQDAQGRQRLIEAINLVKNDFDKILVITHLEELKDVFPNRIEVEKTDKGSVVRVT
jgi:exonuclease SbcC